MEQFQEHARLRVVDADAKRTAAKGDAVKHVWERELYLKGFSLDAIADICHSTRHAVRRVLLAEGVSLRPRKGGLPVAKHGTRSRYTAGCRCIPCRDANTAYEADRRTR